MNFSHRTLGVLTLSSLICGASSAFAQDWPQWRGPNRDGKAVGFAAPTAWPSELKKQWTTVVGEGDATPALVEGKLYVFARAEGEEVALCLDATTGKEIWRDHYAAQVADGASGRDHPGPRSSPAVGEGKFVTFGVRGTLTCYEASSGKVVWRKETGAWPQFFTACSPLIADGKCVMNVGRPGGGMIVAFDLVTGNESWKWTGDGPSYGSPLLATVAGTRCFVALTDSRLVGLKATDGSLLWEAPFAGQGNSFNRTTPIISGDTIFLSGPGKGIQAVKVEKQGEKYAVNTLWTNLENSVMWSNPVLRNGLIFGYSQRGSYFCLDAATGKTAWAGPAGGGQGFGSVVDAGPVVFGLAKTGQLTAFQPSEKGYEQLASYKVTETPIYAHPVIAGKRVFVKDRTSVSLAIIE